MVGVSRDRVAVVTDSTAYLPDPHPADCELHVVPLQVVVAGQPGQEGVDVTPADVARALSGRGTVTTSRPAPGQFAEVYERLLAAGAPGVVSVHLSSRLSGTYDTAVAAAADFDGRVTVVDSRSTGMGLGFPALAAGAAAARGTDPAGVLQAALDAVAATTTLFYVDTLEFLRRGGRIGAATALLGTALSVKPLLHVVDGEVVLREKLRTATRGMARLEEIAVELAGDEPVDVAVHHLAASARAAALAERLQARLPGLRRLYTSEVGAAVGAHCGPGLVGMVVCRQPGS